MKFIDDVYGGDGYSLMAGGAFDSTFAGGFAYSAFVLPKPNLSGIFMQESLSLTALLLGLNEDFVEFVLMPSRVTLINNRYFKKDNLLDMDMMIKDINTGKRLINQSKERLQKEYNQKHINSIVAGDINGSLKFKLEVVGDSAFENLLERVGEAYMGPIGSALAGILHDAFETGEINGANVAEAIYGSLKSMSVNTATKMISNALGVSVMTTYVATPFVSALVSEIFENIVGLDNHFGFGGDFIGANELGYEIYEAPKGFMDGVKDMLGLGNGIKELIYDKNSYYETGQIAGVKIGKHKYIGQIGDSIMSGNRYEKELSKIDEMSKKQAEYMLDELEKLKNEPRSKRDRDKESSWGNKDFRGETKSGSDYGLGASGGVWA